MTKLFCHCVFLDKLYMGPGQLYQDLQNLIHDLSLVNQISSMIGSLKGNYQVLYGHTEHQYQYHKKVKKITKVKKECLVVRLICHK